MFVTQGELRDANEIRLFKLGSEENMMCIVFLDEYKFHVYRFVDEQKLDRCLIGLFCRVIYAKKTTEVHFSINIL